MYFSLSCIQRAFVCEGICHHKTVFRCHHKMILRFSASTLGMNIYAISLKREVEHYQMHRHHEVVLVGTSVGLPPSLQKPLGSCS